VFTGVEKTKVAQNQAKGPWRFHKINTMVMMVWKFKKIKDHHNHGIGPQRHAGVVLRYL